MINPFSLETIHPSLIRPGYNLRDEISTTLTLFASLQLPLGKAWACNQIFQDEN